MNFNDINKSINEKNDTYLIKCIEKCKIKHISILLNNKYLDINIKNAVNKTALMYAIKAYTINKLPYNIYYKIVKLSNIDIVDNENRTILMYIIQYYGINSIEYDDICTYILKKSKIDSQDDEERTALMYALEFHNYKFANILFNISNLLLTDIISQSILMYAVQYHNYEITNKILKLTYIDDIIKINNQDGYNILKYIIDYDCEKILIEKILEKYDVNKSFKNGETILSYINNINWNQKKYKLL